MSKSVQVEISEVKLLAHNNYKYFLGIDYRDIELIYKAKSDYQIISSIPQQDRLRAETHLNYLVPTDINVEKVQKLFKFKPLKETDQEYVSNMFSFACKFKSEDLVFLKPLLTSTDEVVVGLAYNEQEMFLGHWLSDNSYKEINLKQPFKIIDIIKESFYKDNRNYTVRYILQELNCNDSYRIDYEEKDLVLYTQTIKALYG